LGFLSPTLSLIVLLSLAK